MFMWDICMLKSEGEVWIFILMILIIFLYNMLPQVVGHSLLPTIIKKFTPINHVHTTQILIIAIRIVHPRDNFLIFHMNASFSNLVCDSNFNFYNSNWSNQFDFSWSAQATGNYAHQFDEMHHSDYSQFNHQAQPPAYQVPQPTP